MWESANLCKWEWESANVCKWVWERTNLNILECYNWQNLKFFIWECEKVQISVGERTRMWESTNLTILEYNEWMTKIKVLPLRMWESANVC